MCAVVLGCRDVSWHDEGGVVVGVVATPRHVLVLTYQTEMRRDEKRTNYHYPHGTTHSTTTSTCCSVNLMVHVCTIRSTQLLWTMKVCRQEQERP